MWQGPKVHTELCLQEYKLHKHPFKNVITRHKDIHRILWDNFFKTLNRGKSKQETVLESETGWWYHWVGRGKSGKEVKVGCGISEQRIDYGKG